MSALLGAALVVFGIVLVGIALPRQGVTRPFMRGAFAELMYPVLCLTVLVTGVAMVITSVTP